MWETKVGAISYVTPSVALWKQSIRPLLTTGRILLPAKGHGVNTTSRPSAPILPLPPTDYI